MMLVHPYITEEIVFNENIINILVIENQPFLLRLYQIFIIKHSGSPEELYYQMIIYLLKYINT